MVNRYVKPVTVLAIMLAAQTEAQGAPNRSGTGLATTVSGWETERTYNNWGKHKVYFAKDFFRMDDPIRHFSIVTYGPDWIVHYFSDKRKIIYSAPIDKLGRSFSERMGILSGGRDQDVSHWKKIAKVKLLGRDVDYLRLVKDKSGAPLRHVSLCEMYTAPDMKVAPQVCRMFANLYDIPDMGIVPIRMITGTQRSHMHMDTLSVKTIAMPPTMRAIPKGYKKVTTAEAVMFEDPSFF
jgi:hypothetical protein